MYVEKNNRNNKIVYIEIVMAFENNLFHLRPLSTNFSPNRINSKSKDEFLLGNKNIKPHIEVTKQLTFFIIFKSILGVSRLYLLNCSNIFLKLSYIYSIFFVFTFCYAILHNNTKDTSHIIFKNICISEYIAIVLLAIIWQKNILQNYFLNLNVFDKVLKVEAEVKSFILTKFLVIAVCFVIITDMFELYLAYDFIYNTYYMSFKVFVTILVIIIHDLETIFICILIFMMLKRVQLLKAHVAKEFDRGRCNEDNFEMLAKKIQFNVSNLHKVYDLLHSCSEQLSRIISYPVSTNSYIFLIYTY